MGNTRCLNKGIAKKVKFSMANLWIFVLVVTGEKGEMPMTAGADALPLPSPNWGSEKNRMHNRPAFNG
jgi:hypothetical protein